MDVDHLHGGKLLQHAARCQSRRQRMQAPRESDVQAIGQKGNEDVRLVGPEVRWTNRKSARSMTPLTRERNVRSD
jgi:hypothetical protein